MRRVRAISNPEPFMKMYIEIPVDFDKTIKEIVIWI